MASVAMQTIVEFVDLLSYSILGYVMSDGCDPAHAPTRRTDSAHRHVVGARAAVRVTVSHTRSHSVHPPRTRTHTHIFLHKSPASAGPTLGYAGAAACIGLYIRVTVDRSGVGL